MNAVTLHSMENRDSLNTTDTMPSLIQDFVSSPSSILTTLTSLFLGTTLYRYIATWYRLHHIPGPPIAPFTYFWLLFKVTLSGRQAATLHAINEQYGPLARIGPNDLLTNDADVIRRMNGARSSYIRSDWYRALKMDPYHDSLSSILDTKEHDKLKAKLSFGYGGKENPDIESGVDEQLVRFARLIREKYLSGTDAEQDKKMDFAVKIQYFTLDALTRVAYGKPFGFLDADADVHEYIESTTSLLPSLHAGADVPWLGDILLSPRLLNIVGPKATDEKGYGRMIGTVSRLVAERYGPEAQDRYDMLGSFVRHGLGQRACESEVQFQIIAGSDTTATALRGTLHSLLTHPRTYAALRDEIDDAIEAGSISEICKADEGRKLPYLQAVIYEGLRIHIPFSGLVMKEVPPEGDIINGHFVPGGTRVAANFLGVQRSKAVFGEDVDEFKPERWLELDAEETQIWRQHVELVFGSGRWGCSGKALAFMELNKVYVELLRNFDFELVDPSASMETQNFGIFVQSGMWVRIKERQA